MIEKLPLEVFEILYSLLDTKDLIECQCVSQEWHRRWIQLVYRNIHTYGEKQLKNFLNNALPWSIRGQQVRKLVIEKGYVQPETLGKLPALFPFIESFMFDGVALCEAARKKTFHYYQQRKQQEEIVKIKHCFKTWAQHLRQLVEFNGITVTHCILTDNYCPHLTRISLQFNNTNDLTNCKASLLAAFKNVPFLTHLLLERIFLDMDELELIHHHCQKLKSLRLKGAAFLPMNRHMDVVARPALDFRTLVCTDSSFCENIVGWLQYIAAKYCYAETLDIGCCTFGGNGIGANQNNEDYNSCLVSLASNCRRLKRLKLSSFPLSEAFLDVLGKQGTCLKQVTIGDGFECKLQDEMKALIHSRQKNSISELTIHSWPMMLTPSRFGSILNTIDNCPFLTDLVLHMGSEQHQQQQYQKLTTGNNATSDLLSLYQVIIDCPHLISLTITTANLLAFDSTTDTGEMIYTSNSKCTSKLNTLVIENSRFDEKLFTVISSLCVQLKSLSLTGCIYNGFDMHHEQAMIYLPYHSLDICKLDCIRVSRHCSVRLGTSRFSISTQQGFVCYDLIEYEWRRTGYWEEINNREQLRAKKTKIIMDGIEKKAYLSIACKNMKQLYLAGLEVIRDGRFLF